MAQMRDARHTRFISEANRPRNMQAYETSIDLGDLVLTFTTFILSGPRVVCSSSLLGPTRLSHFPLFLPPETTAYSPTPRRLVGEGSPGSLTALRVLPARSRLPKRGERDLEQVGAFLHLPPLSWSLFSLLKVLSTFSLLEILLLDSRCGQVWCSRHALQSSGSGLTLSHLTQPDDELVPLR